MVLARSHAILLSTLRAGVSLVDPLVAGAAGDRARVFHLDAVVALALATLLPLGVRQLGGKFGSPPWLGRSREVRDDELNVHKKPIEFIGETHRSTAGQLPPLKEC